MSSTVLLGANAISFTKDPVVNHVADLIPKSHIVEVTGVFNQRPLTAQPEEWGYAYPTMTMLILKMADGREDVRFELQKASNQPTWNTGSLAALQQAISDINAWL